MSLFSGKIQRFLNREPTGRKEREALKSNLREMPYEMQMVYEPKCRGLNSGEKKDR